MLRNTGSVLSLIGNCVTALSEELDSNAARGAGRRIARFASVTNGCGRFDARNSIPAEPQRAASESRYLFV
ncbi:MAG TPA: hypothetical protein VKB34_23040 [Povalibacter sp.]|nr:hypothetical protein [Povalibacter sp.]